MQYIPFSDNQSIQKKVHVEQSIQLHCVARILNKKIKALTLSKGQEILFLGLNEKILSYCFFTANGFLKLLYSVKHPRDLTFLFSLKKNNQIISACLRGRIFVWERNFSQEWVVCQKLELNECRINCLKINQQENMIISGNQDGSIIIWSKKNIWECTQVIKFQKKEIIELILNFNGNKLISLGQNKMIAIFIQSSKSKWVLQQTIAINKGGSALVFVGYESFVISQEQEGLFRVFTNNKKNNKFKRSQVVECSNYFYNYYPKYNPQYIATPQLLFIRSGQCLYLYKVQEKFIKMQSILLQSAIMQIEISEDKNILIVYDAPKIHHNDYVSRIQIRKIRGQI